MKDLSSLGFQLRTTIHDGEQRLQIYLASTNVFVAWFRSIARISDGERVVSTTTQLVHRKELSTEQIMVLKEWLQEHVRAAE